MGMHMRMSMCQRSPRVSLALPALFPGDPGTWGFEARLGRQTSDALAVPLHCPLPLSHLHCLLSLVQPSLCCYCIRRGLMLARLVLNDESYHLSFSSNCCCIICQHTRHPSFTKSNSQHLKKVEYLPE